MGNINIDYSLKNIPTPTKNTFILKLIDKTEAVIKRMRWKLFWYYNTNTNDVNRNENFDFKSKSIPPPHQEVENFRK